MNLFTLEVWGEFACFTRPELKVERFSYPVITPSAARAIFDAIYIDFTRQAPKQPVMRWEIQRVEILKPIQYIALMRNEVKEKVSSKDIKKWMQDPSLVKPIYADATKEQSGSDKKGRTQRQTMALRDVRYRITAVLVLFHEDTKLRNKIECSFLRRARAGQCFYQPYLGCREFSAYFELLEGTPSTPTVNHTEHVGWMVYDVFDLSKPGSSTDKPSISLFDSQIQNGVLEVPRYLSTDVRKPIGGE
jgi:CRISPR-associated protein Cas5d